jgi:hypothetical protein
VTNVPTSDHGQAFITDDQHPLSLARTKVPWFIRGKGIPQGDTHELTENIDLFKTLVKCCDLKMQENNIDSQLPKILGGKSEREYVLSQSIYPGQTYKAVIRDKYCEYRFESKQVVLPDGAIKGEIGLKDTNYIGENNNVHMQDYIKIYNNIVLTKIAEWNSREENN